MLVSLQLLALRFAPMCYCQNRPAHHPLKQLALLQADRSQVVLPSTNFTLSGSWTLNLWFKRDPGQMDRDDVTNPGYLFSQLANQGASDNPMSPNQVMIAGAWSIICSY